MDEGRAVPLPAYIADKVKEHIRVYGAFRVEEGPNRLWRAARKAAGIVRKITPHWLRHFFASAGLSKGVPVSDMAEWLGHRDPRITLETFAHVMPDAPERLRNLMDSLFTRQAELTLLLEFDALVTAA
ncbi:tyrosine-type recombinase/integrase [Streptomyces roseoviridis]|uniref:tyrosine-type recombinase/integrase n=1 Tax=Streptomyces roseoviridis TaxID=67361 RepID=UPI0031E9FE2A